MSHCPSGQIHTVSDTPGGTSSCVGGSGIGSGSERATCTNRPSMGFDFGMQDPNACYMRKFRWLFQIEGVSGVAKTLPPLKAARPSLSFKEQMVAHLVENIYYPVRPEWKPITLTLYEIRSAGVDIGRNPVMEWVQKLYNSSPLVAGAASNSGDWFPIHQEGCGEGAQSQCFKRNAILCLYDGCGTVMESWQFDNIWPKNIEWGELEMGTSDVVTVDITLRYDRAWIKNAVPGPEPSESARSPGETAAIDNSSSVNSGSGAAEKARAAAAAEALVCTPPSVKTVLSGGRGTICTGRVAIGGPCLPGKIFGGIPPACVVDPLS